MGTIRWAVGWLGYKLRPYDMLGDRRRWCWQKRTRCLAIRRGASRPVR